MPPDGRKRRPVAGSGALEVVADDVTMMPRPGSAGLDYDPLNPRRVPVDQALLDLIHRPDIWHMFSDALLARDLGDRRADYQAGLDAHPGGGADLQAIPSLAEVERRRHEYRGIDGTPARAKTPAQIQAECAYSWSRLERELLAQERRAG